jgi:ammonium transporter Rh
MADGAPSDSSRRGFAAVAGIWQVIIVVLFGLVTEYGSELGDEGVGAFRDKYPFFQDVHVMIFVGFGFLMTYLQDHGYSSVGFNFLISALTIQWAILCNGFWHNVHLDTWNPISLDIVSLIKGDFAAGAVMITFGALLGKVTPTQMFFIMVFEIFFYGLNEMIGAYELHAVDMGGSIFVHTFGAYFGLGCSWAMTRNAPSEKDKKGKNGATKTSDMFAMIGTLFLWMFWPSFNGALAATEQQHRVVINTVLALTASCVMAFVADSLFRKHNKFDMVSIQNATLAGGVAVGSSSDLVIDPWGALLVGAVAGFVSVYGYVFIQPVLKEQFGVDDTCGVHNLHGIPGIIGAIGGVISAAAADENEYGQNICTMFPKRAPTDSSLIAAGSSCETGKGWDAGEQAQHQLWALLVTLGISIASGIFVGTLVKSVGGMIGSEHWYDDKAYWEVPEESEDEPAAAPAAPAPETTAV